MFVVRLFMVIPTFSNPAQTPSVSTVPVVSGDFCCEGRGNQTSSAFIVVRMGGSALPIPVYPRRRVIRGTMGRYIDPPELYVFLTPF